MKYLICLTIILASCQQAPVSKKQLIFEAYLLKHTESWYKARERVDVPIFDFKKGDTVRLQSELKIVRIPEDGRVPLKIRPQDFIHLDSGTVLQFTTSEKVVVTIDSVEHNGWVLYNEFLNAQYGKLMANKKRMFFIRELKNEHNSIIKSLSQEFNTPMDSIISIIKQGYYAKTGREWTAN